MLLLSDMKSSERSVEFLAKKWKDLPGSKPVEQAVNRKTRKPETDTTTKEGRINAYLDRLESLMNDPRGFELLKREVLQIHLTKPEEISDGYWKAREDEAHRQGKRADWEQPDAASTISMKRARGNGASRPASVA